MSSQNSFLLAPAASPSIVGSDADETFTAPNQNTTINGMGGTDTVIFSGSYANYSWSLTSDANRTPIIRITDRRTSSTVTLSNIEVLKFADRTIGLHLGTSQLDTLTGTNGPDLLYGGDEADLLSGLSGSDTLWGGSGDDTLQGGDGDDVFGGNSGDDVLDGGAGEDTATYYNSSSAVLVNLAAGTASGAGIGNDKLTNVEDVEGSDYDDTIIGGIGDNFLIGGLGVDLINGGENDRRFAVDYADYRYSRRAVWASLEEQYAIISTTLGEYDVDGLINIEGLSGSFFNDALIGDASENFLRGNLGNDTLNGAGGSDWALYHRANGAVQVNLAEGWATGADGNDTLISIENVRGSRYADILIGSAEGNMFRAMGGDDTIDGAGGFDWADYREAGNGIVVDLKAGIARSNSATSDTDGTDQLISIEGVRGSMFDDLFYGGAGFNRFRGLKGNDTISGWDGGDEADYSQDVRYGGNQGIVANLTRFNIPAGQLPYGISGAIPYAVDAGTVRDGFGTVDMLSGIKAIRGTEFNDFIVGSEESDTLIGDDGNDTIGSGGSTDLIDAGSGNDMVFIGLGGETVDGGAGNDIVYLDNGQNLVSLSDVLPYLSRGIDGIIRFALPGRKETILRNVEKLGFAEGILDLTTWDGGGTPFDDLLTGSNADETIYGRDGNDIILGNGGNDWLDGGAGNDRIIAGNGHNGQNLIINGSFEDYAVTRGRFAFFKNGSGWSLPKGEIEIWNNFGGKSASEGEKFIELDAHKGEDAILQSIGGLIQGELYYLSFDFSARLAPDKNVPLSKNGDRVNVSWNDLVLTFYSNTKSWQNIGFVVQAGSQNVLKFAELLGENDSYGVHLDNISLTKIALEQATTLVGGQGIDTLDGGMGADRFIFKAGDTGATLATADVIRNFQTGVDVVNVSGLAPQSRWSFSGSRFNGNTGGAELIWNIVRGGVLASIDINSDKVTDYAIFFEGKRSLAAQDFGIQG